MKHVGLLILLIAVFFSGACRKPAASFDEAVYKKEIEKWQSDRLAGLKKEDGWLTLVGLFWPTTMSGEPSPSKSPTAT